MAIVACELSGMGGGECECAFSRHLAYFIIFQLLIFVSLTLTSILNCIFLLTCCFGCGRVVGNRSTTTTRKEG